jgi:hypothetical protein
MCVLVVSIVPLSTVFLLEVPTVFVLFWFFSHLIPIVWHFVLFYYIDMIIIIILKADIIDRTIQIALLYNAVQTNMGQYLLLYFRHGIWRKWMASSHVNGSQEQYWIWYVLSYLSILLHEVYWKPYSMCVLDLCLVKYNKKIITILLGYDYACDLSFMKFKITHKIEYLLNVPWVGKVFTSIVTTRPFSLPCK